MYDYEIETIMHDNDYRISRAIYRSICDSSSQIVKIKYNPWDNSTEMETTNGRYWKFYVMEE